MPAEFGGGGNVAHFVTAAVGHVGLDIGHSVRTVNQCGESGQSKISPSLPRLIEAQA